MRAAKTPVRKPVKKPVQILPQSEKNLTFALDIGTRSIVGILGVNEDSCFRVIDYEQQFHLERTMRDGQIENIELVAKVIASVKETLESRNHVALSSVCIAAAGRTLITKRISHTQDLDPNEEITPRLLHAIEYCALGMAQAEFENEIAGNKEHMSSFYCVGYSVIKYILDGYESSTILGHKGNTVSIEVIAAFLPQNVVQSLYAVTNMNGLTVENLTLEPIAAINVIVPKDIRLLNIALVDIGAGTSDIALSKNGSIVAYDMVTTAGDEITEMIMQKCLTNFTTAEEIKLALGEEGEEIEYTDILGLPHHDAKQNIITQIQPAIDALGESISKRILDINNGPPMAVFLVGGGSQIPGLSQVLSTHLSLDGQYIAIAGKQPMQNIKLHSPKLKNPEFITPIGIGALTSIYNGCDFFSIMVNGKRMMLLNQGESKVLDALLLSSVKPQSLIGISSRAVTYYINGKRYVKKGVHSVPGELYVNGKPASVDTVIKQGDEIVAKEAIDGKSPVITIADVIDELAMTFKIHWNGQEMEYTPTFTLNGRTLLPSYVIKPLDDMKAEIAPYVSTLFQLAQPEEDIETFCISINGQEVDADTPVKNGDQITTSPRIQKPALHPVERMQEDTANIDDTPIASEEPPETAADVSTTIEPLAETPAPSSTVSSAISANDATETVAPPANTNTEDTPTVQPEPDSSVRELHVCINEIWRNIPVRAGEKIFFFDMLNYVDIDPHNPQGNIVLKLNGQEASYTSQIFSRDVVEIYWEQ